MNRHSALVLNHQHIVQTVQQVGPNEFMSLLIDGLESAFASFTPSELDIPIRTGFQYDRPVPGFIEWMLLHHRQQAIFMKSVGYHPTNPAGKCLPTVMSTFHQIDPYENVNSTKDSNHVTRPITQP